MTKTAWLTKTAGLTKVPTWLTVVTATLLAADATSNRLTDATSKSRLVLDQLWFAGEVRSLVGPIRGKGEFVTSGGLYGYDISAGRAGADGTRLKFSLKTDERPLTRKQ